MNSDRFAGSGAREHTNAEGLRIKHVGNPWCLLYCMRDTTHCGDKVGRQCCTRNEHTDLCIQPGPDLAIQVILPGRVTL